MEIAVILGYISPIIVYLVTLIVTAFKPNLSGAVVVSVIVPALSLALAGLNFYIGGATGFWLQFALNLLAVFIKEFVTQIKSAFQE